MPPTQDQAHQHPLRRHQSTSSSLPDPCQQSKAQHPHLRAGRSEILPSLPKPGVTEYISAVGGRDTSFHAPVIDSRKSCQRQLEWWLMALVNDCRVLGLRRCRLDIHKEAAEASCLHRDTTQHLPGVPSSCQQHCAVLSGHKRKLFTTNAHSSSREKT